jgi:26S proteasome regulatory subunit T2
VEHTLLDLYFKHYTRPKNLPGAFKLALSLNESFFFYVRERRMKVTDEDFKKSKENVLYRKQEGTPEGLYL